MDMNRFLWEQVRPATRGTYLRSRSFLEASRLLSTLAFSSSVRASYSSSDMSSSLCFSSSSFTWASLSTTTTSLTVRPHYRDHMIDLSQTSLSWTYDYQADLSRMIMHLSIRTPYSDHTITNQTSLQWSQDNKSHPLYSKPWNDQSHPLYNNHAIINNTSLQRPCNTQSDLFTVITQPSHLSIISTQTIRTPILHVITTYQSAGYHIVDISIMTTPPSVITTYTPQQWGLHTAVSV